MLRRLQASFRNLGGLLCIGANPWESLKLFFFYSFLSIKRWLALPPEFHQPKRLTLQSEKRIFPFWLKRQLDFDVIREAFFCDQYALRVPLEAKTIVDLGSNIGATVLQFKALYPQATIYAVEPDPRNAECLRLNAQGFGDEVVIHEKAVHSKNGIRVPFHSNSQKHWSSSLFPREGTEETVDVETISLEALVQQNHLEWIDILKFDIEGAEEEVFKQCAVLDRVRYAVGELHPNMFTGNIKDVLDCFQNFTVLSYDEQSGIVHLLHR